MMEKATQGRKDSGRTERNGTDDSKHHDLLETCRAKWRNGEWEQLATMPLDDIDTHPERAKITLLVASALSHTGDLSMARSLIRRAATWGCSRSLIASALLSMVHNSLGRTATSFEEDKAAASHFEAALGLLESRADIPLMSRTRRVQETARMGLLPDAAKLVGEDWRSARAAPTDYAARIATMRTELDLIGHELSLSLRRGQIMNPRSTDDSGAADIESHAVSQLGQDIWVLQQTAYKRNGFFVEFGATDGVRLSNSWLLETEFGWNGICAEPNPGLFRQLQQNRRCTTSSACIGGVSGQEVEFILADAFGGIAEYAQADSHVERREAFRMDGKVMRMTTISLNDFLIENDAPREIDYLSIDTEGSEYEILSHFPFDRWRIRLITVEHNRTPMREKIRSLLEPLGYRRTEVEFDDWYVLDDRAE